MSFQDNLATMSDIAHLSGLNVRDAAGNIVRTIPAAPGKLGSLKLYNALAQEYSGRLNAESAERGLTLFADTPPTRRPTQANTPTSTCCLK